MKNLLIAICAGALAFGSAAALADDSDMKPLTKMQTDEAKAARAAAKEKWAKMTPEQQAAAKKAAAAKNRTAWTATDEISSGISYDAKMGAQEAAASKTQPKPTAAERQQYGTTMDKKASSGQ